MLNRSNVIFLTAALAVCLARASCLAFAGDGFGNAKKIESRHFTIYYAPGLDTRELSRRLSLGAADKILSGGALPDDLGGAVDLLFSRVCDILDMQLYSFHGTLKICCDRKQVDDIYGNLFDKPLAAKHHSFYIYDSNTIYLPAEQFNREVLGHEMGHAVISHYFVVPPSIKIQEVLAVFVEYQLRKE